MEKSPSPKTIARLLALTKAAGGAAGIDQQIIVSGAASVAVLGTGLFIDWARDAFGRARPGWVIRQTYHALDLVTNEGRMAEDIVLKVQPDELFLAARAAIMAIVRRQVESAMEAIGD